MHFWSYHSECFDGDDVDFTFLDAFSPTLGNVSGSDGSPILSESAALSFPSRVRFVTALLSGSNGQVDFSFTGDVSAPVPGPAPVPEPSTGLLLIAASGLMFAIRQRRAG